jgi:hypothetical protein
MAPANQRFSPINAEHHYASSNCDGLIILADALPE